MANESAFQSRCLEWVKGARPDLLGVNFHQGGWNNKGFPDVGVLGDGRILLIELKDGDAYDPQPAQVIWQRRLERVGTPCKFIRTFEEFVQAVEKEYPT